MNSSVLMIVCVYQLRGHSNLKKVVFVVISVAPGATPTTFKSFTTNPNFLTCI